MCTTPIGGRLSVSQCQLRPNSSTPFLLEGKTHEPTAGKKAGRPKGATSQTVKKSIFNSSGKKKTRTHTQNKRVEEFLFLVVFFSSFVGKYLSLFFLLLPDVWTCAVLSRSDSPLRLREWGTCPAGNARRFDFYFILFIFLCIRFHSSLFCLLDFYSVVFISLKHENPFAFWFIPMRVRYRLLHIANGPIYVWNQRPWFLNFDQSNQ